MWYSKHGKAVTHKGGVRVSIANTNILFGAAYLFGKRRKLEGKFSFYD